ncbi:hypothetical protein ACIBI3_41095 [Actinomadura luteofluorescens]|uniref:hypothetical protein n=1 Tax=Actinomadura luteofluorescens TaxID=46163 RepID=UPI00348F5F60
MTDGTENLTPLTTAQYEQMLLVSRGVDREWYDSLRAQCPDVSHEEFVASQERECPWPLYLFAVVREVATAEEAEEVWKAARERGRTDDFMYGYNYGRKAGLSHDDILSADAAGVSPFTYTSLRQEGDDHDKIVAAARRSAE